MSAAPGWYPDNAGTLRYWDGMQWTEHTAPELRQPEAHQYAPPVLPQQGYPQPYASQPSVYAPRLVGTGAPNGVATAGFIVGLVSVFLPLIFGLAVGATGLVLSIVGAVKSSTTGTGKGLAVAGIVLSSVGIIFIL